MDGGVQTVQSVDMNTLRRIHYAFGEALRKEHMSRELDWLLYEH
jgi:hypothetical protein